MRNQSILAAAILASAMAITACDSDDIATKDSSKPQADNQQPQTESVIASATKSITLKASTEGDGGSATSKTAIDGLSIKWQTDDAISVFDGTNNNQFTLTDGAGTPSGTFDGKVADGAATTLYALYPYQEGETSLSGNTISNVDIPTTQTIGSEQSVDPKAMLMTATSDDAANLQFKNVMSYIKVKPTIECSKIVVISNGGEALAGTADITIADDGTPSASVTNGSSEVTLQASEGNLQDGTYYIGVLPGTLSNGIKIRFYTDENHFYESNIDSEITLERSQIHYGGKEKGEQYTIVEKSFEYSGELHIEDNPIEYTCNIDDNIKIYLSSSNSIVNDDDGWGICFAHWDPEDFAEIDIIAEEGYLITGIEYTFYDYSSSPSADHQSFDAGNSTVGITNKSNGTSTFAGEANEVKMRLGQSFEGLYLALTKVRVTYKPVSE